MVMNLPRPPLFFWEPRDLTVFRSVDEAESYLEAVDVRSGDVGRGYDALGRKLEVSVEEREKRSVLGRTKLELVRIALSDDRSEHADELREILVTYLEACGAKDPGASNESATLEQLIGLAVRYGAPR